MNGDVLVMEACTLLNPLYKVENTSLCNDFASRLCNKFRGGPDGLSLLEVNNAVCAWMNAETGSVDPKNFNIMEYYEALHKNHSESLVRTFALWAVGILKNLPPSALVAIFKI